MKQLRTFWLALLNTYHLLLVLYWLLRGLFGGAFWWLAFLNTFALLVALPLLLTLPLALLLRGTRTSIVAFLLALIAVLRFIPSRKPVPAPAKNTLRLITYNLWNRNPRLASDVDWLLCQNADVIVMQEAVAHHTANLSRLIAHYPYSRHIESDILLVTRYPMLECDTIILEATTTKHSRRRLIRAVLDVDGQPMTVYAVHLSVPRQDSVHFPLPLYLRFIYTFQYYDETRRNQQIHRLLAMIEQEKNPVIVAGDFNMSHTSTIYDTIREAGLIDAYAAAGQGIGFSWPTVIPLSPLLRIDYVWHSADLRTVQIERGMGRGSDHLPLIVDIAGLS